MLEQKKAYKFEEIINYIKKLYLEKGEDIVYKDNNWCVYAGSDITSLEDLCYIEEYPDYDDDDNEIFSDFIVANGLELIFREELLQDVIINVLKQKNAASIKEIFQAINYYDEKDAFMNL